MPGERLLLYNMNDYDVVANPYGFGDDGHRKNFFPLLRDVAEVTAFVSSPPVLRLAVYYTENDYDVIYEPGGIGNDGHRVNFIPAIQDVALVAESLGLSNAPLTRLSTYYNSLRYNALSNPGGMARGGHRVNFLDALDDLITVARDIANSITSREVFPAQGALTVSTTAPTVTVSLKKSPAQGNLTLSTTAPTVFASAHHVRTPAQGNLTLSTTAPNVVPAHHTRTPAQGNLVLSSTAPTVQVAPSVSPSYIRFIRWM